MNHHLFYSCFSMLVQLAPHTIARPLITIFTHFSLTIFILVFITVITLSTCPRSSLNFSGDFQPGRGYCGRLITYSYNFVFVMYTVLNQTRAHSQLKSGCMAYRNCFLKNVCVYVCLFVKFLFVFLHSCVSKINYAKSSLYMRNKGCIEPSWYYDR